MRTKDECMRATNRLQPPTVESLQRDLLQTQSELATIKKTLGTAILWISQSAASPLSVNDAKTILDMLPPEH